MGMPLPRKIDHRDNEESDKQSAYKIGDRCAGAFNCQSKRACRELDQFWQLHVNDDPANTKEQRHLQDRLGQLHQPLDRENTLQTSQRVDAIAFEMQRLR